MRAVVCSLSAAISVVAPALADGLDHEALERAAPAVAEISGRGFGVAAGEARCDGSRFAA